MTKQRDIFRKAMFFITLGVYLVLKEFTRDNYRYVHEPLRTNIWGDTHARREPAERDQRSTQWKCLSANNKVFNTPRVESSKEPGSYRVDRTTCVFRFQKNGLSQKLSTCCEQLASSAPALATWKTFGTRWRSPCSDFWLIGVPRGVSRLGRKKARKVEKGSRWTTISIDSIRRRATSRTKRKVPPKKTSGRKRRERKKEMKTYVIRSNLTHAAHAGGTTIRDRICRHRLRVVLVGNGNLEGLSIKHWWRWEILSRAHRLTIVSDLRPSTYLPIPLPVQSRDDDGARFRDSDNYSEQLSPATRRAGFDATRPSVITTSNVCEA